MNWTQTALTGKQSFYDKNAEAHQAEFLKLVRLRGEEWVLDVFTALAEIDAKFAFEGMGLSIHRKAFDAAMNSEMGQMIRELAEFRAAVKNNAVNLPVTKPTRAK